MAEQPARRIYLDYNATAPVPEAVARRLKEVLLLGPLNPSSQHLWGQQARRVLEQARARLLGCLNALGYRLVFTSGGTEANNLALLGLTRPGAGQVLVSSIEHPSVSKAARRLAADGLDVQWIRATSQGTVDLDHLAELLRKGKTQLVSVMLANNETGVLQPVAEVVRMAREMGALVHCDVAQAVGKIPVDLGTLGVDAATLAGHKFGAPVGVGALVLGPRLKPRPLLYGGPQELELRPGTEPAALADAMAYALELIHPQLPALSQQMEGLRAAFEQALLEGFPEAIIHGHSSPRTPQTTCIAFPGVDRQRLVIALDLAGIACSAGSACASGAVEPSPTLRAMQVGEELLNSSVRLSFGPQTTQQELTTAAELITRTARSIRGKSPAG